MYKELLYYLLILYFTFSLHISLYYSKKSIYENFTDNPKINQYELVISSYNEDLKWLEDEPFNKFKQICYHKGPNSIEDKCKSPNCKIVNLENVGRCDHTYLYHIINNYDNLAPITIFLPGSCVDGYKFDIATKVIKLVNDTNNTVLLGALFNDIPNDIYDFKIDEWKATNEKNNQLNPETKLEPSPIRPFGNWFKENFGDIVGKVVCYFGIFAVSKEHIIQHPKEHYEKLIKYLDYHSNPEAGHYMERSWSALFYPYPDSCIYNRDN